VLRNIEKDVLIVRDQQAFQGGRFMVCVDGSSYSYKAMKAALELAQEFGGSVFVCSAFDVEYHHVVFHNIKDVLSYQASKVFKFEEQEELHNNIIDKGLLKLCQANLKRAEVMAQQYPDVRSRRRSSSASHFQVIMQWVEEIKPSLLVIGRHGAHRVDNTELGSQAENLLRLAPALCCGRVWWACGPRTSPGSKKTVRPVCPGRPKPRSGFSVCRRSRRGSRAAPSKSTCSRK